VLNLEREFGAGVLQPFLDAYLQGSTPSPCVDCNSYVKFGALLGRARRMYECDAVATGHYARVDALEDPDLPGGHSYRLLTGLDADKDQSYFLYGLRQDQLAHVRFPLGELAKPDVRAIAHRHGLATADKPESQEICFVPGGVYRDALRSRAGWTPEAGPIVDVDGSRVGDHRGIAAYTVGQRQGLGVAVGAPRYVSRIDPLSNTIQLGRREDLEVHSFTIERASFVAPDVPDAAFRAGVRIRHRAAIVAAEVRPLGDKRWSVVTDTPVWAASPGQAAVLYAGDEVLGGGRIEQSATLASHDVPRPTTAPLVRA
jgi:tRNA-specific 2-thiouridylase